MILNDRCVLVVDFFNLCGNGCTVHVQRRIQQALGFLLKGYHFIPTLAFNRHRQLLPNFFVRDKRCFSILIISKIAQVNHVG